MGMMKRRMPVEILSYKEKMFFGLTVKQLISGAAGVGIVGGMYLLRSQGFLSFVPQDVYEWINLIVLAPIFVIFISDTMEVNIETLAIKFIQFYGTNQRRKVKFLDDDIPVHNKILEVFYGESIEIRKAEKEADLAYNKAMKKIAKAEKKENKCLAKENKKQSKSVKKNRKKELEDNTNA